MLSSFNSQGAVVGNLTIFLKELTNIELAIFIGYQYDNFLPDSKERIKAEVLSRNLDAHAIALLFGQGKIINTLDEPRHKCPRCSSSRIFNEKGKALKGGYVTYEITTEKSLCLLCGFNQYKGNPKFSFKKILKILFGFNSDKKENVIETNIRNVFR